MVGIPEWKVKSEASSFYLFTGTQDQWMSGDSVQLSAKENGVYFACYEQRVLSEMSVHLYSAHAGSVDSRRKWMKTNTLAEERKMRLQKRGTPEAQCFSIRQSITVSRLHWSRAFQVCAVLKGSEIRGQTALREVFDLF